MSKTEAAEILGLKAKIIARNSGREISKDLVEEVLTEAKHWDGLFPVAASIAPHWRSVLKAAQV